MEREGTGSRQRRMERLAQAGHGRTR